MQHRARLLAVTAALALTATGAQANVMISSDATQNMSCSNGVCTPTATKAVLNAGDLETLLASGNVEVTTTNTDVQAKDIDVKAAVAWSSSGVLTLDAHRSIAIDQPVSVTGLAGLALDTSDGNKGMGGTLTFGKNGNVTFANLSSSLMINGGAYTLVGDIKTLAAAIAANPSGDFAMAASYDASQDGTYASTPIPTTFTGNFEGLGNAISNLSLDDEIHKPQYEGFFAELGTNGSIANFGLSNASVIHRLGRNPYIGTLVGFNAGTINEAYATGSITGKKAIAVGGLVGLNEGTINASFAAGTVKGTGGNGGGLVGVHSGGTITNSFSTGDVSGLSAGGLVGLSEGPIDQSYATGNVHVTDSDIYLTGGGGFAGRAYESTISNSYATGSVRGQSASAVGGFVGYNGSVISSSYSTGSPSNGEYIGGLIGYDEAAAGSLTDTDWDTDTSGVTDPSQGAGNIANDPGITGLTTAQFQSGLPAGFDPKVWAEKAKIIDGFPYLLKNAPSKR